MKQSQVKHLRSILYLEGGVLVSVPELVSDVPQSLVDGVPVAKQRLLEVGHGQGKGGVVGQQVGGGEGEGVVQELRATNDLVVGQSQSRHQPGPASGVVRGPVVA